MTEHTTPPGSPELSLEEAQAEVETKVHPRVTEESINKKINTVNYVFQNQLTICIITMDNGFMVNGQSAPADPRNFDKEVGKRYAYNNAFRQLWPLEGYLLCEQYDLHG